MSDLPIVKPTPDYVAESGNEINEILKAMSQGVATALASVNRLVAQNPNHTSAEFWERQGTNGVALLQKFGRCQAFALAEFPELLTPEVVAAGSTLVANQDGTVTVPAE